MYKRACAVTCIHNIGGDKSGGLTDCEALAKHCTPNINIININICIKCKKY